MRLTVLSVPGCANRALLEERLAQALRHIPDTEVVRHEVTDQRAAERWGMRGSPTVLIDGVDPFAEQGQPATLACRLYRDTTGRVDGAPSVERLREAIAAAV